MYGRSARRSVIGPGSANGPGVWRDCDGRVLHCPAVRLFAPQHRLGPRQDARGSAFGIGASTSWAAAWAM
jgi:hypothetical protein